ncbi:PTS sugar transporter subunit IIA [uncultured Brachyspira sp.]|uniref:PTS sugar transporter subunit IIA n=1 Tax=uncultured Brachyspira sp. TaxID=221953 RepID=UPI0025EAD947|nr:PTS sugar transporter subunit IIA [uncultured Brachyspira sp.]
MRKFLIMSHGDMSSGIKSTLNMLLGNIDDVAAKSAYINDNELSIESEIQNILSKFNDNDELIIFTDLFGGSVNNEAMKFIKDSRVKIIAGMNICLIIEVLSNSDSSNDINDVIRDAVNLARESIIFCNDLDLNIDNDDF